MPDLSLELAEAFQEEGFWFSDRWHTWGRTCKNGCHDFKDGDGYYCHVPTLHELIEFVDGNARLDALTLEYAHRALRKMRTMPREEPTVRRRPHGKAAEIISFPQKSDQT
jgi:hypothetical protein